MKGYFRKRGKTWSFTLDIGKDAQGKRKQKTKSGFKTKKEAEKACAELITQIENGGYKEPSKVSLGDFILEYMENHVKHQIRTSTFSKQMVIVRNHILPDLGYFPLVKLTPMVIQKFYNDKLKDGYTPSYIRGIHAILSKTLKTAAEWEYIPKNIAPLVKPPRIPGRDIQTWSREEVNHFLELVEKRRFYIAYVLAIYTGMRKGEILALRWQDCNLEEGWLSVRQTLYKVEGKLVFQEPKTRSSRRTISIPGTAVTVLRKHRVQQNQHRLLLGEGYQDQDLVVCNGTGNPVDPGDINRDMKYIIRKHQLTPLSFHDLRHTHATLLLQLGEHPKVVSERLGHANVGITLDTYSHVLPDMQKSLAQNFDLSMRGESKKKEG
jgi:integrase